MADVMVFDLNGEVNEDQPLFELNENVIILVNNFIIMFKLNINKYVLYLVERQVKERVWQELQKRFGSEGISSQLTAHRRPPQRHFEIISMHLVSGRLRHQQTIVTAPQYAY